MAELPKYKIGLDLMRILAAFLVVYIHTTDPFLVFDQYKGGTSWWLIYYLNTLSRIAVPVFVLLSGYLLFDPNKIEKLSVFYKKRVKRIGIPFVLWLIILFIWRATWGDIPISLEYIFTTIFTVDVGFMYFMFIIVELYLLTPILWKYLTTSGVIRIKTLVILGVLSFLSAAIPYAMGDHFRFSETIFTITLPYIFYFAVGGYLRNVQFAWKVRVMLLAACFAFGLIATVMANGDHSSIYLHYFNFPLVIMSISFFTAIVSFEKLFSKTLSNNQLRIISHFSGATLGVYLIHIYVIEILLKTTNLSPGNIYSPLWLVILGIVMLVLLICVGVVVVGKRIPLVKYLFD